MVNRLQSWIFLSIAMIVMGLALFPVLRAILGQSEKIEIQFLTVVTLLIAGLMCGLTAMLLMVRRQPDIGRYLAEEVDTLAAAKMHASGLLIFTGIPLANFLACFFFWIKHRNRSSYLDYQGREAVCFQITIYLYLMMSLFMAYVIIGVFAIPLILLFHLLATITATVMALSGKPFRYPANINIISRAPISKPTPAPSQSSDQ